MSDRMAKTGSAGCSDPVVGLIMGSDSDWQTMRGTAQRLEALGITCDRKVVSAHRTPDDLFAYAEQAEDKGLSLIIAAAGGAAHLPGMTASKTIVPVIGVPVIATPLRGIDALLSIMQMPAEVGVATVGTGARGADQAALFAATILSRNNTQLQASLSTHRDDMLKGVEPVVARVGCEMKVTILTEDETNLELLENAAKQFRDLKIPFTMRTVEPGLRAETLLKVTREESEAGAVAFIAVSVDGIDLGCRIAQTTFYPVLGVPIVAKQVDSIDRFVQSFLELPSGVATFAVGRPGVINAALFAATILSLPGSETRQSLHEKRAEQVRRVRAMKI